MATTPNPPQPESGPEGEAGKSPAEQRAAILARVRGSEHVLARRMAADERTEISSMPAEIREIELPHTARAYYALVTTAIAEGRGLVDAELEGVRQRGEQRALEDFPLHLFLHNWLRGAAVLWDACVELAAVGEEAGLREIASRLYEIIDQAACAGVEAYADVRATVEAHDRGDGELVARLLLAGQDAAQVAHEARIDLAPAYDVLALSVAAAPEEQTEEAAARGVAARRKVLRVRQALAGGRLGCVLMVLDAREGHVLLPREDDDGVVDAERCRQVVDAVASAAGADVTGAASPARLAGIPAAAAEARELLRVAIGSGLGPGFHGAHDMALQIMFSRPGVARDHLLSVLARLEPHGVLVDTLERLLSFDGDRGRTARSLGVHPNTVNNRLAKAERLLGFDPTSTHGVVTVTAALAARRVAAAEGGR